MKVLFVGESWFSYGVHVKGFDAYYTGEYEEGGTALINALQARDLTVTYLRNHEAIRRFPNTAEALAEYDAVVFSDVGSDTLLLHPDPFSRNQPRPNPLNALRDFVANGGGFLMIGGFMSFSGYQGRANYHNTPMADVLPVRLSGIDDRVERPEGCRPAVVSSHPSVDGLPAEWPQFLGYNRLQAKPEASVVATVGDDPFLVVGDFHRGRVAAFASDCSPHWATPGFVEWDHYPVFWGQLVRWLGGRNASTNRH